jgi:hypothetical protein
MVILFYSFPYKSYFVQLSVALELFYFIRKNIYVSWGAALTIQSVLLSFKVAV